VWRSINSGISNSYRILVGKSEGKRSLKKPRRRLEDGVKMYIREMTCESVDYI
jgi:hypothetical protein